jgi:hypothetical protein
VDYNLRRLPKWESPEARALIERGLALKWVPNLDPHDLAPSGPLARGWVADTTMVMQRLAVYQNELDEEAIANARNGR